MKTYNIDISFTGRCNISVKADNAKDAIEKVMSETKLFFDTNDPNSKDVEVDDWDWGFITKQRCGKV